MLTPYRTVEWVESNGRHYRCELDIERNLLLAEVQVRPHDKRPTLRVVKHPVTMARLQEIARPANRCEHCGAKR